MKHIAIVHAAINGAVGAYLGCAEVDGRTTVQSMQDFVGAHAAPAVSLYSYCRDRRFPPAETLWRKYHEMVGVPVDRDYAAIAESERAFFITFRAIVEALEPMHDGERPTEEKLEAAWAKFTDGFVADQTDDPDVPTGREPSTMQDDPKDEPKAADGKEAERKDFQSTVDAAIADATGEGNPAESSAQGTAKKAKK